MTKTRMIPENDLPNPGERPAPVPPGDLCWGVDKCLCLTWANEGFLCFFESLTGNRLSVGDPLFKHSHLNPLRQKEWLHHYCLALSGKTVHTEMEIPPASPTGTAVWYEMHLAPGPLGGDGTAVVCLGHNTTTRKYAEQAVQKREARLHLIFQTLTEGVALNEVVYDENGDMMDYRILEVNDAFYRVADYDPTIPAIGALATRLYGMSRCDIRTFWAHHQAIREPVTVEYFSQRSKRQFTVCTSPFLNHQFITTFREIPSEKNK